jgi:broad-specificity NMP kinase
MEKLLVLSGPAGAGKSTTVQSLAQSFGIQIVEWINPLDESKLITQTDGIMAVRVF